MREALRHAPECLSAVIDSQGRGEENGYSKDFKRGKIPRRQTRGRGEKEGEEGRRRWSKRRMKFFLISGAVRRVELDPFPHTLT